MSWTRKHTANNSDIKKRSYKTFDLELKTKGALGFNSGRLNSKTETVRSILFKTIFFSEKVTAKALADVTTIKTVATLTCAVTGYPYPDVSWSYSEF